MKLAKFTKSKWKKQSAVAATAMAKIATIEDCNDEEN